MHDNYAGVKKRALGGLIDTAVAFLFLMIFCTIFGGINVAADAKSSFSFDIFSLPFIGGGFLVCVVFAWMEVKYGKTPGKHFMKTKVISATSVELSFGQALIRNLFRPVDYFLLMGLLFIAATTTKQRLGDLSARTFVVMEE